MERISGILHDKVCLVTGAGRGIGQSIVMRFAQEGAIVYANVRKKGFLEEWIARHHQELKGKIIPVYFDITDSAKIRQIAIQIKEEQGKIDVLVNNAGVVSNELLGMISKSEVKKMFEVNVFGLLELTQLIATKFMIKQKKGSIINMASIVGAEGSRGQIAYSASKGAVIALTKSMAKELAEYNVRVNAIAPGIIDTERIRQSINHLYKNIPQIGMGRLGTTEEISGICVFFASEMSTYVTGQILEASGSMML